MSPSDWDWGVVTSVSLQHGALVVEIGPVGWTGIVAVLALVVALRGGLLRRLRRDWSVVDFDLPIPGGKCRIARNQGTAQLAHETYIELITRKAALPWDDEHDSIEEIYNSWYELFREARQLARRARADEVRHNEDLARLLQLLTAVMNDGLRPHLTRWQSRFRVWLAIERTQAPHVPPADLQRQFPGYSELVVDLKIKSDLLAMFANCLRETAYGGKI